MDDVSQLTVKSQLGLSVKSRRYLPHCKISTGVLTQRACINFSRVLLVFLTVESIPT
jgi:hypothetical protein